MGAPHMAGSTAVGSLSCPCPHLGFRVLPHRETGRLQGSAGTYIPCQGGMDVPPARGPGVPPAPSPACSVSTAHFCGVIDTEERWFQGHRHLKLQRGTHAVSQCGCPFYRCDGALGDFSRPRAVAGPSEPSVTPAGTPTAQLGKRVHLQAGAGLAVLGVRCPVRPELGCLPHPPAPCHPMGTWSGWRVLALDKLRVQSGKQTIQTGTMKPGPGVEHSGEQTGRQPALRGTDQYSRLATATY